MYKQAGWFKDLASTAASGVRGFGDKMTASWRPIASGIYAAGASLLDGSKSFSQHMAESSARGAMATERDAVLGQQSADSLGDWSKIGYNLGHGAASWTVSPEVLMYGAALKGLGLGFKGLKWAGSKAPAALKGVKGFTQGAKGRLDALKQAMLRRR